jgi:hypothetical protein
MMSWISLHFSSGFFPPFLVDLSVFWSDALSKANSWYVSYAISFPWMVKCLLQP